MKVEDTPPPEDRNRYNWERIQDGGCILVPYDGEDPGVVRRRAYQAAWQWCGWNRPDLKPVSRTYADGARTWLVPKHDEE